MSDSKAIEFNADERAQQRQQSKIHIGGQSFRPRKRTADVMKEWVEASPDPQEDRRRPEEMTKEELAESAYTQGGVFAQLAVLLETSEGERTTEDFLRSQLDVEDAVDLLVMLMPKAEGAPEGNPSTPAAA